MTAPSAKEKSAAAEQDVAPPEAGTARAQAGRRSEPDPLIGRVISDRFRILAPIARGGMGVVYEAEQAPLGRLVALKVLSRQHDARKDPEFRKRFFLEAATVAKLTHPNTVTVFDYGQSDDGIYYIAMELVNGRTLKAVLAREGPFPAERAVHIAQQICRSLREAHRLGVIHRDMKPGNVMLVDRDGEDYVKVLDFGLVKELDPESPDEDLTQAGVFMGSPKYMSPEQIQGEHVDGRTDIYAIGVMLYEMLTGRVPFDRDNPMQILMDHVREPVPPMTVPDGKPPIPPELCALVSKCLEKKASDRYPDMEALLLSLKQLGGDGLAPRSASREIDISLASGSTPISGVQVVGPDSSSGAGVPAEALAPGAVASAPTARPSTRSVLVTVLASAAALAAAGGLAAWSAGLVGGAPTAELAVPDDRPHTAAAPPIERSPSAAGAAAPTATGTAIAEPTPTPVRSIIVSLRSTPPGATVRIGEREYGPTPAQVELVGELAEEGRELEMVFERAGHRATTVTQVVSGSTMEVHARLPAIRRSGGGGARITPGVTRVEGYRDSPY